MSKKPESLLRMGNSGFFISERLIPPRRSLRHLPTKNKHRSYKRYQCRQ